MKIERLLARSACALAFVVAAAGPVSAEPVLGEIAGTGADAPYPVYRHVEPDAERVAVLVHDWFGVTPSYLEFADDLNAAGYAVIAVDLYHGESGADHGQAFALMNALDAEAAGRHIDAAIAEAGATADFVAVIGFSMGTDHALRAAGRAGEIVDAAAIFYGSAPAEPELLAAIGDPVLAIFAGADAFAGPEGSAADAADFARAGEEAGTGAEIHVFPLAAHAFAQPLFNGGATYQPELRAAAWALTTEFLDRQAAR